jgi:peptide/nickel transport system ATP-binding protein
MIAMALSCRPKLLIADEPTAALDVTIQAQIMDLLLDLRQRYGMAILLVSHDLGLIARLCDRIAVLYLGRIVEVATATELYDSPLHPYTRALLRAVPVPDPHRREKLQVLEGEPPSQLRLPRGSCPFLGRCPVAVDRCRWTDPPLTTINSTAHQVACVHYAEAGGASPAGIKDGEKREGESAPYPVRHEIWERE